MKFCDIHYDGVSDYWACESRSMERCSELIVCEDGSEIVWVDYCIVTISPFGIDIPVSCQGVQLSSEVSGAKRMTKLN